MNTKINKKQYNQAAKINEKFSDLLRTTVGEFKKLEAMPLPLEKFRGAGIYALYYKGRNNLYSYYKEANKDQARKPIYVGQAKPSGWMSKRSLGKKTTKSTELYNRIMQKCKNLCEVQGLSLKDFSVRYMVLNSELSGMADSIEGALIRKEKPLWNACLDGFGNNNPGKGRMRQAPSDWDIIHPGRPWVEELKGSPKDKREIREKVKSYLGEY